MAFYKVFIPVGVTIMVGQINLTVNFFFAGSFGEGVISYLNYAFRLVSIPQAIFGVTVATIIYPLIARAISEKDEERFKSGIEKGITFMLIFADSDDCYYDLLYERHCNDCLPARCI